MQYHSLYTGFTKTTLHLMEMRRKTKEDSPLSGLVETLATKYGKVDEILLDTGPKKGKYRVVANLKRKVCPECKAVHYCSLEPDTCLGCTVILKEEKRLGRKMTREERTGFLRKVGF